jgi:hypothetical protein
VGTAVIQALPAKPDGTKIGSTSLIGGVWAISISN